jgi:hypothetical protein
MWFVRGNVSESGHESNVIRIQSKLDAPENISN